jgi:hypothetical protein
MALDCCKLVNGLVLNLSGCIISISMNSSTEIIKECDGEVLIGATNGTLSLNAFVSNYSSVFNDCATSASLSVPWNKRYDCDADKVYFINSGKGSASKIGDPPYASIITSIGRSYPNLSASVGSGPSNVYSIQTQEDGYGLIYTGGPISFNSGNVSDLIISFSSIVSPSILELPAGTSDLYLQSFNVNYSPGEIPTANYSFAFSITEGGI